MSKLSRRTLVTSAATLPALAVPAIAAAEAVPASACTLPPNLIEEFVRVRARLLDSERRDVPWSEIEEICEERWSVAKAMLDYKPQTFADLAWQAEAYLIADLELIGENKRSPNSLLPKLFLNIRTLGALPQPEDPLGQLNIHVDDDSQCEA